MTKLFRFAQRCPVILAVIFYPLITIFCWYIFREYKSTNIFYLSNFANLICVLLFIIAAEKYQNDKVGTAIVLAVASFLFVLTMCDFYLITFCYDTSGPAGENAITHVHWYNKFVSNNEYGFWERALANDKILNERHNRLVIAAVGDSFTWGQGLKGNGLRFSEKLEKKLNSDPDRKRVRVLNFGRGGADTVQEMEIIEKYVPIIHPDIVLLCYISNDIVFKCEAQDYDKTWEVISTINPTVNFFYWRTIGAATAQKVGLQYMECLVNAYNNPEQFKKHVEDLQTAFRDVRRFGAKPVFVLLPFPHMWKLYPKQTRDDVYDRLRKAVSNTGTPIVDLSYIEEKYSLEDFQVNSFDGHPNEKMHEEFAEAIYRQLVNNAEFTNILKKQ